MKTNKNRAFAPQWKVIIFKIYLQGNYRGFGLFKESPSDVLPAAGRKLEETQQDNKSNNNNNNSKKLVCVNPRKALLIKQSIFL